MFNLKKEVTPETYVEKLKEALPGSIRSVILFGSAATGEHVGKRSDYNLLVITDNLGVLELNQLAKVTQDWLKAGNPAPLFFTEKRLQESTDCFPIEMLDMKQFYKVLCGDDLLKDLEVHSTHLRLMIEREIKSLKIQLQQGFIFANARPERVAELVVSTISTALVLMRASLRLYTKKDVPEHRIDVPAAMKEFMDFDEEAFTTAYRVKKGELKFKDINPMELFERYLQGLVTLGDKVDSLENA